MRISLEARLTRLEAASAARRAQPAIDSTTAATRISQILAATEAGDPATTKAARRAARVRELMHAAVARQLADQHKDIA